MKFYSICQRIGWWRVHRFHVAGTVATLLIVAAAVPSTRSAQGTNSAPGRVSFSDFRMIPERNIFNPNRTARASGQTERRDTRRTTPRTTEYVTLLGTMSYQKGPLAFFEGSRSEYKKTITPGDKIAGFGVAAINSKRVMLNAGTNWLELPVGKQLRREEEGEWRVADAPERQITSYTSSSSSSSSSYSRPSYSSSSTTAPASGQPGFPVPPPGAEGPGPLIVIDPETGAVLAQPFNGQQTNGAPAAASPGDPDEVLRRLMQRREEEMNR